MHYQKNILDIDLKNIGVEGDNCMDEKIMDTNKVKLVGKVIKEKTFSHEMYGEGFYIIDLKCFI